jgi:site-specific recombinase XerD
LRRRVSNVLQVLNRNKLKTFLDSFQASVIEMKWFFSSPNGKRWDPDNLSRYLRKVNDETGLDWNGLVFRHTFGSQLAMKGESLYKISALMGNSPEICRRLYAVLILGQFKLQMHH